MLSKARITRVSRMAVVRHYAAAWVAVRGLEKLGMAVTT